MSTKNCRSAIDIIAAHAANLRYEDLSEMTIIRARQVMLDTLGTSLGGYQMRLGRLTADFAAQRMPGEEASLVADGRSSTAEGAAWANGVLCHLLEMDDTSRLSGHVASQLVPALLALGEPSATQRPRTDHGAGRRLRRLRCHSAGGAGLAAPSAGWTTRATWVRWPPR